MSDLKRMYFETSERNRTMISFVAAVVLGAALFVAILQPELVKTKTLRENASRLSEQVKLVKAQQEKFEELGRSNLKLGSEQLEYLAARGNEVLFEGEVERFIGDMKEINEKVGGSQFAVSEGAIRPGYIAVGPRKDIYTISYVPLTLDFKGDYAAASNFIFQLRAMKRLMTIDNVDIVSKDYSAVLNARIQMGLYFVEEI
ncbi:MAG TPA: type II secretion system protein GspM [bacterium]|nr:type II secretion system protein GspM [bacterium]